MIDTNGYIPCSNEVVDFLYNLCRNAQILGIDRLKMKERRFGGTAEFRLFIMGDVPDYIPFETAGIVRVSELYRRLRFFMENSKGEEVEAFYKNVEGTSEAARMLFRSKKIDLEYRFGSEAAVGRRVVTSISDPCNNSFVINSADRQIILKGVKAMGLDEVTIANKDGSVTFSGRDGVGDRFNYTLETSNNAFDFSRLIVADDFRKLVQHFDNKEDVTIEVSDQIFLRTVDDSNEIIAIKKDMQTS